MATSTIVRNSDPGSAVLTQSLCPVCLRPIRAWRREESGNLWLHKGCPQHGDFATPIWRGPPHWKTWQRPKRPAAAGGQRRPVVKGCPFDCGLCSNHRQRSCTVLIEVTQRCNLICPICFADAHRHGQDDPSVAELCRRFETIACLSPGSNIQLSGGEPSLRDDLPEIVRIGKQSGFGFIQLNSNGIRPALDRHYLKNLAAAGLDSIFLQFDGTQDIIFQKLRGRPLLEIKRQAISACKACGLGVVLVVTVVPEINCHNLGAILDFAVEQSPTVRGVHFQPISYFGRYPATWNPRNRITLPELMQAIEIQTRGAFPMARFKPPGCENAMCSFSGKFLIQADRSVEPLLSDRQECCGAPQPADHNALHSIAQTARQWSAIHEGKPLSPASKATTELYPSKNPMDLDRFIQMTRSRTISVSAMAFQDAWSLDLDRVRDCCIHVADTRGRLIPFCLFNLTSISGQRLYRL